MGPTTGNVVDSATRRAATSADLQKNFPCFRTCPSAVEGRARGPVPGSPARSPTTPPGARGPRTGEAGLDSGNEPSLGAYRIGEVEVRLDQLEFHQ